MKVKVISRNPANYQRETKYDIHKVPRNYDPTLHPFETAREYTRALNAVKLERLFAKPFVGNLDGHSDGVSCLGRHPHSLSMLASGAYDGDIRLWDLASRVCLAVEPGAHQGIVKGMAFTSQTDTVLHTIGTDKAIKTWRYTLGSDNFELIDTILSQFQLSSIAHQRGTGTATTRFVTGGEHCHLWEGGRKQPIKTFRWGVDSVQHVAYNPIETHLFGACASDRSVILYDTRDSGPIRKVVLKLCTNQIAWNPMEAYIFTCANEDYNLYSFDTRQLRRPVNVHMNHVAAVTCVAYAPTGKEFVSGSYDKTVRIYECDKGNSRDIYHTKRMQRLTAVEWSQDNKYVLSASDEMNVRIWKARAAEKLGPLKSREKAALNYSETLKVKFASHPQVKRIARHRQVPKHVYNAQQELRTIRTKLKRKESNRRAHSKPGSVPYESERSKHVLREDK